MFLQHWRLCSSVNYLPLKILHKFMKKFKSIYLGKQEGRENSSRLKNK